jgi:hypothetical protein
LFYPPLSIFNQGEHKVDSEEVEVEEREEEERSVDTSEGEGEVKNKLPQEIVVWKDPDITLRRVELTLVPIWPIKIVH